MLFKVDGVERFELEGMAMGLGVVDVVSCVEEFVMIILYPCPTRVEIEFSGMENLPGGSALGEIGPDRARKGPRDVESLENGIRTQKPHLSQSHTLP